jgi:peptidoglycan/LPS O-acetylase OafA/YrhL
MARETTLKRMVYVGIGLVIAEAAFLAFVVIPRMATHPEAVGHGSVRSHLNFVIVQLIIAAALLALVILNRHKLRRIKAFLNLAGALVILLSLMMFTGAGFYLDKYRFYDVAILLFICIAANLIAGILFLRVPVKLGRLSSPK